MIPGSAIFIRSGACTCLNNSRRNAPRRVLFLPSNCAAPHSPRVIHLNMAYQRQKQYRLPGHTYGEPGSYFITICVKDRDPAFGEIVRDSGKALIQLTALGKALADEIECLERKYVHLLLGRWQIMPDHLHLILHLDENAPRRVPTCPTGIQPLNAGSVSSIANHLKGYTTKWARSINVDFCWQHRFNDCIIRDGAELTRIENYIINNPETWLRERNQ